MSSVEVPSVSDEEKFESRLLARANNEGRLVHQFAYNYQLPQYITVEYLKKLVADYFNCVASFKNGDYQFSLDTTESIEELIESVVNESYSFSQTIEEMMNLVDVMESIRDGSKNPQDFTPIPHELRKTATGEKLKRFPKS